LGLIKVDYALQGHRRIDLTVIRWHGVIDPVNIQSTQIDTPVAAVAVKDTPHQYILHLHGQAKYGYLHARLEHVKLITKSARMKRQPATIGCLALNNRNDDRKTILADKG
jgi:hypothetical protein